MTKAVLLPCPNCGEDEKEGWHDPVAIGVCRIPSRLDPATDGHSSTDDSDGGDQGNTDAIGAQSG